MRLAGLLTAVAVVIAACSSGGGGQPPGFVRVNGSKVSVARPGNWRNAARTSKLMTVSATSPSQNAEVEVLENLLTGGSKGSKDMLVDTVEAGPMLNGGGYHRTRTESIDVKGAKAAVRVDYAFNDDRNGPSQAVDVGILGKDEQIHAVRVIWRRGALDEATRDGIIDSIEVS